ncbi:nuclear transport factor 2 family protein [Duganella radicis]|uniref:Polyketide cyclase n=1 Tax=Duganella radicis TaxID=551988 RepID=A0A6L6PEF6_9BURK|nr:nuclear transport factor 2 family protein [Duganella radicis]MTV36997.1 polyketide cyclase [Duganella radicis]
MIKKICISAIVLASLSGAAWAQTGTAQEEANRQTVLAFYEKGLNQKDADAALQYVGDHYIQHNPFAADGREGFRNFIAFMREKMPNARGEIRKSFADGDYVILHVYAAGPPGTRGSAIVDIFRLEKGKIVEHWDVAQPIPENPANANTMF